MTFRVDDNTLVGTNHQDQREHLPNSPILLEETGKPVTADTTLSLEEPDELVQVTTQTGGGEGKNDSHTGKIAATRIHMTSFKNKQQ